MDGLSGDTDTPHSLTTPDWMPPLDFCINIIAIAVLEMQKVAQSLRIMIKSNSHEMRRSIFLNCGGPTPLSALHWYEPASRLVTVSRVRTGDMDTGLGDCLGEHGEVFTLI